ncbi:CTP synthase [Thermoclostridium caenicola]|uniref:CTP synthase n=1 Tax=Thermoclostridium caenicola TaxID=659425 RepID=A0A1M6CNS2_9FIRM|nr:CTP synthase [Thermoclostridium caenicola]SHI62368.1 CTP synthase [Thermoclostridium caenicola]HOP71624.1 CTP synthase [Thermoclostridium caenicola]
MTKFIFITGGVVSGLGKGITAASLGRLLKQRGLKVAAQKLDPYMNVDPGTMSPFQHGEVFVTDDGAETDLDLGHYERFIDEDLTRFSNLTSGKVYWNVLNRERSGGYLGKTVQVIPHITGEIKDFIYRGAETSGADVLITEIGGTTGDIESQPFLEAIRQISLEKGRGNCLFIHVTLVPYLKGSNEHKSKPTQHSVKELQSMGISPDIIIARADEPFDESIKDKISLFCNVKRDCVIENLTLPCLYEAPLMLHKSGLDRVVCRELGLETPEPDLREWENMVEKIKSRQKKVVIAIVGKYVKLHDAYLSIIESLNHAGYDTGAKVEIRWVESEDVKDENVHVLLDGIDGMIIPGGFGDRGIDGKIIACRYARENNIPLLGICLGMQIAVIEYARHVCGLAGAHSSEFDANSPHPVIDLMEEQKSITQKGGTMRLGAYPCITREGTLLRRLYGQERISERHRHRYEFNNAYRDILTSKGLVICGTSPDNKLVEAVELPTHRFFIGVQYHPEFKSRPTKPHPLFLGLLKAALNM